MTDPQITAAINQGAEWIAHADAILVTAGAGMGVDSGLPDFRGDDGFWQAYPALGRGRIRFVDIANGGAFKDMPARAWGFYGHRLQLYRDTVPHAGFGMLRAIGAAPGRRDGTRRAWPPRSPPVAATTASRRRVGPMRHISVALSKGNMPSAGGTW